MKILMLFIDMLRPNRFGCYNNNLEDNSLDELIRELGGTLYTNCFSPAPDTPRSMACFYSGLLPKDNGCDTRVKWPGKFMKDGIKTIFDPFIQNNYKMNFFTNPNERQGGLLPPGIEKTGIHNQNFNLSEFVNEISLAEDHFVFISIPDFHWAMQDWSYTRKGEREAISETRQSLNIIFDHFDKDDFDHIFLFSDHGFKFSAQLEKESIHEFVNRDRTNIFMFTRERGNIGISYEDKICSIQDVIHTVNEIFGLESEYSLINNCKRDYVVIEDHFDISSPKVNQNLDIWAVVTKSEMYVRTLNDSVLIKNGQFYHNSLSKKYDAILETETQFGRYSNEHKKVFAYHQLILAQTNHMNGNLRNGEKRYQRFLIWIERLKDRLTLNTGNGL